MKRIIPKIIIALLIAGSVKAGELDLFWRGFPEDGFSNKLSSYGYDRNYARTASVAFVDGVVHDVATNSVKRRIAEYTCVLFYMDRTLVNEQLSQLERDASPAIRNAAKAIRTEIQKLDTEKPKKQT